MANSTDDVVDMVTVDRDHADTVLENAEKHFTRQVTPENIVVAVVDKTVTANEMENGFIPPHIRAVMAEYGGVPSLDDYSIPPGYTHYSPNVKTYKSKAEVFKPHSFNPNIESIDGGLPKIVVSKSALDRIWHYVNECDDEIGWLGTVVQKPDGVFYIEEVFLLDQEVTAATTVLSEEGQANLVNDILEMYENGIDIVNRLNFWGHSHVRMEVNPSWQDDKTMMSFKENGLPYYIRGIFNKLGKARFDIYYYNSDIKILDIPWSVEQEVDGSLADEIKLEISQKVKKFVYKPPKHQHYTHHMHAGRGGHFGKNQKGPSSKAKASTQVKASRFNLEEDDFTDPRPW